MDAVSSKQSFLSILGSSSKASPLIWAGITGAIVVICTRVMHNYLNKNMPIPQFFKSRHFYWLTTGGILLVKELIGENSVKYKIATLVISIGTAVFTDYLLGRKQKVNPLYQQKANPLRQQKKEIEIPEKWDEDKFFQQYICAINFTPTLNPVFDPIAKNTVYDRPTVFKWVCQNSNSPMTRKPWSFWKVHQRPIISNLLLYRLKQLQEYEKSLNGELLPKTNPEHLQWVEKSAQELNGEIKFYIELDEEALKMKLKTLTELPPFLDGETRFWSWHCSHTGKVIVHHLVPKLDHEAFSKDPKLRGIWYDKYLIEELLNTSSTPKNWPNQLEFTQENLYENFNITYDIQESFLMAIQELKDYYTPFDPPQKSVDMEETIEITKDN